MLQVLGGDAPDRVVATALEILGRTGVEVHGSEALSLLGDHGARIDPQRRRAYIPAPLVSRALDTAPPIVRLFDASGALTHEIGGSRVYFAPGSAAMRVLDSDTGVMRPPRTADYVEYVKVAGALENLAAQSTAFIPADVPAQISDSYRLYLSLLYGQKPVVTGTFSKDGLPVMRDLQVIVRGSESALREKPLAIFTCCPTSPLKWSDEACYTLVECARGGIPVEIVPMPLAGFTAPVTLAGTIAQHAAEALSGLVLHQLAAPGAPALYGGSTAIFDVRYETTPMGAAETMMLACGCAQIGARLGLPTQGYIALSDAKQLDAQAGAETGMGALMAALCGINQVSGPGMLDCENAFSIDKLVLDDHLCGAARRLRSGITAREEPLGPVIDELLAEGHLLIADHTRQYLREEIRWPSPIVERASLERWEQDGRSTLLDRTRSARAACERRYQAPPHAHEIGPALTERMLAEARKYGMNAVTR